MDGSEEIEPIREMSQNKADKNPGRSLVSCQDVSVSVSILSLFCLRLQRQGGRTTREPNGELLN